tara:strand:- start:11379 stop:12857 length:1479 start_codon:yes stop_codon:yes gene_type:complete
MATKIGFKLQDKAIVPDASTLFDLSDTLLAQEDKREKQRQTWRDEQDALRKSQRDLTPTANQNANQFFGKFSQGIMDVSTTLQKQLESGRINSSEYAAQWRNLNQSNEQMIAAQTSYQKTAQQIADDVASGKSSEVNTANLNHFNKVFQPGAMEVERDGRGGLKLFNKETGDIVSPSYLSDLTNGNLPKYDYSTVAKNLVDQFGKRGITKGSGKTITGVYANMSGKELDTIMQDEAKALLAGAQAPTVSILVDGMGYNVVYNEKDLKPGSVYRKPDGTFGFAEGDEQKAVDFMAGELRKALPREVKERQELSEYEKDSLQLRRDELAERIQARKDKGKEKVASTIMADAKSYLEKNILLEDLKQKDDADVITSINQTLSEFGISIDNPINLIDGQSIRLTQVDKEGKEVTEEILLPSNRGRDIIFSEGQNAEDVKQSIITFVLENVNARSLSALKNKLSPANTTPKPDPDPDNPEGGPLDDIFKTDTTLNLP